MDEDSLSALWREKSLRYVSAINALMERGQRDGWDNLGSEPLDDRADLAADVLDVVRAANQSGDISCLREKFPPAHGPFLSIIEERGQSLEPMSWVDNNHIAVRIYQGGLRAPSVSREPDVVIVDSNQITKQPGIRNFGTSPDRRFFAVAYDERLEVHQGWDRRCVISFAWPSGREGMPPGEDPPQPFRPDKITQLVVFPDGQRVLVVSPQGIFVLTDAGAIRLLRREHIATGLDADDESAPECELAMEHGAVSPRGDAVVIGYQDMPHLAFNGTLEQIGSVGYFSEYPNFAWFSADGELAALSSCHMFHGATVGVPVAALPGLNTPAYEANPPVRLLDEGPRVHAAVCRDDEFVIGDVDGFVRAFDFHGGFRWRHFIGSTIQGLSLSPDGRRLAVSSYAGILCVLELDTGTRDPFAIGTATHRELQRWLFWRDEAQILRW
jgi:hypothetical protein